MKKNEDSDDVFENARKAATEVVVKVEGQLQQLLQQEKTRARSRSGSQASTQCPTSECRTPTSTRTARSRSSSDAPHSLNGPISIDSIRTIEKKAGNTKLLMRLGIYGPSGSLDKATAPMPVKSKTQEKGVTVKTGSDSMVIEVEADVKTENRGKNALWRFSSVPNSPDLHISFSKSLTDSGLSMRSLAPESLSVAAPYSVVVLQNQVEALDGRSERLRESIEIRSDASDSKPVYEIRANVLNLMNLDKAVTFRERIFIGRGVIRIDRDVIVNVETLADPATISFVRQYSVLDQQKRDKAKDESRSASRQDSLRTALDHSFSYPTARDRSTHTAHSPWDRMSDSTRTARSINSSAMSDTSAGSSESLNTACSPSVPFKRLSSPPSHKPFRRLPSNRARSPTRRANANSSQHSLRTAKSPAVLPSKVVQQVKEESLRLTSPVMVTARDNFDPSLKANNRRSGVLTAQSPSGRSVTGKSGKSSSDTKSDVRTARESPSSLALRTARSPGLPVCSTPMDLSSDMLTAKDSRPSTLAMSPATNTAKSPDLKTVRSPKPERNTCLIPGTEYDVITPTAKRNKSRILQRSPDLKSAQSPATTMITAQAKSPDVFTARPSRSAKSPVDSLITAQPKSDDVYTAKAPLSARKSGTRMNISRGQSPTFNAATPLLTAEAKSPEAYTARSQYSSRSPLITAQPKSSDANTAKSQLSAKESRTKLKTPRDNYSQYSTPSVLTAEAKSPDAFTARSQVSARSPLITAQAKSSDVNTARLAYSTRSPVAVILTAEPKSPEATTARSQRSARSPLITAQAKSSETYTARAIPSNDSLKTANAPLSARSPAMLTAEPKSPEAYTARSQLSARSPLLTAQPKSSAVHTARDQFSARTPLLTAEAKSPEAHTARSQLSARSPLLTAQPKSSAVHTARDLISARTPLLTSEAKSPETSTARAQQSAEESRPARTPLLTAEAKSPEAYTARSQLSALSPLLTAQPRSSAVDTARGDPFSARTPLLTAEAKSPEAYTARSQLSAHSPLLTAQPKSSAVHTAARSQRSARSPLITAQVKSSETYTARAIPSDNLRTANAPLSARSPAMLTAEPKSPEAYTARSQLSSRSPLLTAQPRSSAVHTARDQLSARTPLLTAEAKSPEAYTARSQLSARSPLLTAQAKSSDARTARGIPSTASQTMLTAEPKSADAFTAREPFSSRQSDASLRTARAPASSRSTPFDVNNNNIGTARSSSPKNASLYIPAKGEKNINNLEPSMCDGYSVKTARQPSLAECVTARSPAPDSTVSTAHSIQDANTARNSTPGSVARRGQTSTPMETARARATPISTAKANRSNRTPISRSSITPAALANRAASLTPGAGDSARSNRTGRNPVHTLQRRTPRSRSNTPAAQGAPRHEQPNQASGQAGAPANHKTPREAWANVKPGPNPIIMPADSGPNAAPTRLQAVPSGVRTAQSPEAHTAHLYRTPKKLEEDHGSKKNAPNAAETPEAVTAVPFTAGTRTARSMSPEQYKALPIEARTAREHPRETGYKPSETAVPKALDDLSTRTARSFKAPKRGTPAAENEPSTAVESKSPERTLGALRSGLLFGSRATPSVVAPPSSSSSANSNREPSQRRTLLSIPLRNTKGKTPVEDSTKATKPIHPVAATVTPVPAPRRSLQPTKIVDQPSQKSIKKVPIAAPRGVSAAPSDDSKRSSKKPINQDGNDSSCKTAKSFKKEGKGKGSARSTAPSGKSVKKRDRGAVGAPSNKSKKATKGNEANSAKPNDPNNYFKEGAAPYIASTAAPIPPIGTTTYDLRDATIPQQAALPSESPLRTASPPGPRTRGSKQTMSGLSGPATRSSRKLRTAEPRTPYNSVSRRLNMDTANPDRNAANEQNSALARRPDAANRPNTVVLQQQMPDGSFKVEMHISLRMNNSGQLQLTGVIPPGLETKKVLVNGREIWAAAPRQ